MAKSIPSVSIPSGAAAFGFASRESVATQTFRRGPSVDDLVTMGVGLGIAAVMVMMHLFGIKDGPSAADDLKNALQWYVTNYHGPVVTKSGKTVDVVQWSAFKIPTFALRAARAGSLSGEMSEETAATLARIYYNDSKSRTLIREHAAEWTGRPFVPTERPAAE